MDLNRVVSYSLRVGALVSAFLSVMGLIIWTLNGFPQSLNTVYSSFDTIFTWTAQGNVVGIIYLAVIILIATPLVRIIISSAYFAIEKDKQYVGITLTVLGMMLFAIFFLPR